MGTARNLSLIFKRVPKGMPIAGQDLCIEDRPLDISSSPDNGFITKNLYASLDPYMRMMLIPPGTTHYRAPFDLDQPLASGSIAEIIHSRHSEFPVGSVIRARLPIQEFSRITPAWLDAQSQPPDKIESAGLNISLGMWLGPLGMPGQTAYSSVFDIGKPQRGETIFISSAGGAVGSLVGQICGQLGLRVVGSVGSDEKVASLIGMGFHGGFNYKSEDIATALQRLCPNGIDIYYDNVGGEQLELAIDHMNQGGRIVVCGMISQYNTPPNERYGIKNLFKFVEKGLTMKGFLVGQLISQWGSKHRKDMSRWLNEGSIKGSIDETEGIANAAEAFVGMLKGENKGKAVVKIHT